MRPTEVPVSDFLDRAAEGRRADAEQVMEVMHRLTGAEPVMWGPSIIGYGTRHYVTAAGREGDVPLLSLSPRKANLVVYVSEGLDDYGYLLGRLGKHRTGASCLYLGRLSGVDVEVLAEIIARSHRRHALEEAEVVSYGLIGYRIGKPRSCRMYVSGWKDHIGVHPVHKDEALESELAPYRKGKGTPWFPLDELLPRDLLLRTAAFMARP